MDSPKLIGATQAASVEIDYDRVNVAEIMTRIQKAAAEAPAEISAANERGEAAPASASPRTAPPAPPPTDWNPEPQGAKQTIKKILRKLMRPFFPVIRLLALPIHEELRATIKSLHETNVRLDNLYRLLQMQAVEFDRKIDLAGERMDQGDLRLDHLEGRLKDLDKSMEYIRLLHNLDHNLVLELTKLKVEEEALKSKVRVLEKELETLGKREKAIEKRAFK